MNHRALKVVLPAVALAALILTISGCTRPQEIRLPPTGAVADYQLGGGYAPESGVRIVSRDSSDVPAPGLYSICYVNGFQSQPGEVWPTELLVSTTSGALLTDPGWPDEHILNISTAPARAKLLRRMQPIIAGCARHGFDAIEFDNLDSYSRSAGALTAAEAVIFAISLVALAHRHGLAAAQKNAVELAPIGATTVGFDFAMAEECFQYRECAEFSKVYGDHVIDVEYTDTLTTPFSAVCASARRPTSLMLRDRQLRASGSAGHVYRHC